MGRKVIIFFSPAILLMALGSHAQTVQQTIIIFPHIANGEFAAGRFQTSVILINPTPGLVSGELSFFRSNGNGFFLTLASGQSGSTFPFVIVPGGSVIFQTDGTGPLDSGWARVTANAALGGTIIFSQLDAAGNLVTEAGVGAAALMSDFSIPVDTTGNFDTGIAFANPSVDTITATLRLYDLSGFFVGKAELPLASLHQAARFITEFFPNFKGSRGTLSISSSSAISAIALRLSNNSITTLPVTRGAFLAEGGDLNEREPNGSISGSNVNLNGNMFSPNAVISGAINPAGDVDVFFFFGRQGQAANLRLEALSAGSPLNSVLLLMVDLNEDGRIDITREAFGGGKPDSDPSLQMALPKTAFYFIVIIELNHFDRVLRGNTTVTAKGGPNYTYRLNVNIQ